MFGFFKNEIKQKIKNANFSNTDDVVQQWNEIGRIILDCEKKNIQYVEELLGMCYAEYQKIISNYQREMKNLNMSSSTRGRRLYECYDMIKRYGDEYDNLLSDLCEHECYDKNIGFTVQMHHMKVMSNNIRAMCDASCIIEDVSKKYFGETVKNITIELEHLAQKRAELSTKLTQEFEKNNLNYLELNDVTIKDETLLETSLLIKSKEYVLKHPDIIKLMEDMENLNQKRRKLMEELF